MTREYRTEIENRFACRPPFGIPGDRRDQIRQAGKEFALRLEELCPMSTQLIDAVDFIDMAIEKAHGAVTEHEQKEDK